MRTQSFLVVASLALMAFVALLHLVQADPISSQDVEFQVEPEARGKFQLNKLLDFNNFKRLFKKNYRSLMEEIDRRRLFMARAFRTFVIGMKYKFNLRKHYESINHMSDYTTSELERMRNKVMAKASRERNTSAASAAAVADAAKSPAAQANESDEKLPEFIPDENEDVEGELKKLIEEHGDEPGYKELREALEKKLEVKGESERVRRKRDTGKQMKPRELPQLINIGQPEPESPKVCQNIKSNNPFHEPLELASFGLTDQQERLNWWRVKPRSSGGAGKNNVGQQLHNSLKNLPTSNKPRGLFEDDDDEDEEEDDYHDYENDEIYFDHRESQCFFKARDQGDCGCCYAFASVSIMEWMHCIQTGKLVAFSEQYMVDCGKDRYGTQLDGCEGASDESVAAFIHNFGMELRSQYPYAEREQSCPYDEDYDLKKTGYIRFQLSDATQVPRERFDWYIEYQPMLIGLHTSEAFNNYGGGVDDGSECGPDADHAVVLVGHGRDRGEDYWLIRNSYGDHWGEAGYYKLAKSATSKCIDTNGIAFGTKNARQQTAAIFKSQGKLPQKRIR